MHLHEQYEMQMRASFLIILANKIPTGGNKGGFRAGEAV